MFTLDTLRTRALLLAPALLPDAATAAPRVTQCSCNAPRRCSCCLQGHAKLLQRYRDAATIDSGATQRSCDAPGRCNC